MSRNKSLKFISSFVFILVINFSNCDRDKGINSPELTATADYVLTFESTWSGTTHPTDFPASAHFSGLIGATHNSDISFWQEGQLASLGIKDIAERGLGEQLRTKIATAIQNNLADEELLNGGIATSPGSVSFSFKIRSEFPLITVVSMIAPSPDWFIGVSNLSLVENGQWIDEKVIEIYAFDAGTDSGISYISTDLVTTPQENISQIQEAPFKVNNEIPSIGTFKIVRQ